MGNDITARTAIFKGLNRMPYIEDGELRSMKNLSSDAYPFLSTRKGREEYLITTYVPGVKGEDYFEDVEDIASEIDEKYIGKVVKNLKDGKFYIFEWDEDASKYVWKDTVEPLKEKNVPFEEYLKTVDITLKKIYEIGQLNGKIAILFETNEGKIQLYYEQKLFETKGVSDTPGKKLQTMGNKLIVGECGSYLYKDKDTGEIKLFPSGESFVKTVKAFTVSYGLDDRWDKKSFIDLDGKTGKAKIVLVSKPGKGEGYDVVYDGLSPSAGTDFKIEIKGKEFYLETENCTFEPNKVIGGYSVGSNNYTDYADILTINAFGAKEDYYWESKYWVSESITLLSTASYLPDTEVWKKRLWGYKENYLQGTVQDVFDDKGQIKWTTGDNTYTEAISQPIWQGGDITGLAALSEALILFKEDSLTVFSGNYPAVMQASTIPARGLSAKDRDSVAVANETVYYLNKDGVYRFGGGIPQLISRDAKINGTEAVGASDGKKYWISIKENDGNYALYVYDISLGIWHKEDETKAVSFANLYGQMCMATEKQIFILEEEKDPLEWEAELWYDEGTYNYKKYKGFEIRGNLGECEVYLKADDGEWQLYTFTEGKLSMKSEPFRCRELGIKLKGRGICELKSLDRTYEIVQ